MLDVVTNIERRGTKEMGQTSIIQRAKNEGV
jgi:hypothetical protein